MPIKKDIAKYLSKLLDVYVLTDFYPKLLDRNSKYNGKNDYKIDDNTDYIFIHVPRTGGIAFSKILNIISKEKKINFKKDAHYSVSIYHSPLEKNYITIFRNPVLRAISYYQYNLRHKTQPYHYLAKKSVSTFFNHCKAVHNTYCKYLSGYIHSEVDQRIFEIAKNNLKNFKYVLNFDDLDNEIVSFSKKFDCSLSSLSEMPNFGEGKYTTNDDQKKLAIFHNYYDIKLFEEFLKS